MWEVITRPLLLLALDEVALVSEDVTKQLRALFEFAVEDVYPTLPVEQEPVGMPAKVHFLHVCCGVLGDPGIRHGGSAGGVQKNRVRTLREELE